MVKPEVIVLAHTATSYTLGRQANRADGAVDEAIGIPFITAFGSVVRALEHLGVEPLALGTPYSEEHDVERARRTSRRTGWRSSTRAAQGVTNIYDETAERAYALARRVDMPEAQAIFISGVGMPRSTSWRRLERELGKPVISSAAAMMWNALRVAKAAAPVAGYGSLLSEKR